MTAGKHTPGPWFASDEDGEIYSLAEYTSVAMVLMNGHGAANARLIAAAPVMLEALEEARVQIEILQERLGIVDTGSGTLSIIRAAISKAQENHDADRS